MSNSTLPPPPSLRSFTSSMGTAPYNVLAFKTMEPFAKRLQKTQPGKFCHIPITWEKFEDSKMDHIVVGGFSPVNRIRRSRVLFLADFHSNDAIMSQLHVLVMLCESFIEDLIILVQYLPVATMERIVKEGEVATANTVSRILSQLPPIGRPARVMFYDLHTLQQRFYLHTNALASMHTAIPLIKAEIKPSGPWPVQTVAFPDEGAQKRFGKMFAEYDLVVCGKKRVGKSRTVVIQDGDCKGKHVLIVDDIVKTGGTLAACAKALVAAGAAAVSAYCTHAAFPKNSADRFCPGGDRAIFRRFYVTNSNPTCVARINAKHTSGDGVFRILDLMPLVTADL